MEKPIKPQYPEIEKQHTDHLVDFIIVNPDIVFGAGMLLGFLSLVFWEKSKGRWNIKFAKDKKMKKEQIL